MDDRHDLQVAMRVRDGLVAEGSPDNLGTLVHALLAWRFARLLQEQGVVKFLQQRKPEEIEIYARTRGQLMPAELPFRVNIAVHAGDLRQSEDAALCGFLRKRRGSGTCLDAVP